MNRRDAMKAIAALPMVASVSAPMVAPIPLPRNELFAKWCTEVMKRGYLTRNQARLMEAT